MGTRGVGTRLPPFEAFVERHRRTVYRFLLVAVGPGEADDVFQETFLAALRAYPLWRAVRSLPPRQRAAVVHRLVLDRPYGQIAEALGSSEQAVRANVSQGVRRLRALLSEGVGR